MTGTPKKPSAKDTPAKTTAPKAADDNNTTTGKQAGADAPAQDEGAAPASTDASAETPSPSHAPRDAGSAIAVVVAMVVISGALAATYPYWSPYLDKARAKATVTTTAPVVAGAPDAALTVKEDAAPTTEKPAEQASVVAAETMTVASDPVGVALSEINERLQGLEDRVRGLETAPSLAEPVAAVAEKIAVLDAMMARLVALEARAEQKGFGAGPLVFAIDRLREALNSAAPFRADLDAVAALVGDDETLAAVVATLRPYAESGVISLDQVRRGFDTVATEAARVTPVPGGDSWWEKAINHVGGLISVRKVDGLATAGPRDMALALAETALAAGDVDGAVAAVAALEGEGLRDWRVQAQARAEINKAARALAVHVSRLMGAPVSEAKP